MTISRTTPARPVGFNPQALDNHYGLDLACQSVFRLRPSSVRICTPEPALVVAVLRRLGRLGAELFVENDSLANAVAAVLGERPQVDASMHADVALVPFARQMYAEPPDARHLVLLGYNALSYKSLLAPGKIRDTLPAQMRWMARRYQISERVGMFTPGFITRWAISAAAGPRIPELHFRAGQQAMDRIYTTGAFWWTGYVTLLSGPRRQTSVR